MFTNAGNSEFSRDFFVQTDFDKTALDDIYGNLIKLKNMQKTGYVSVAAQANASAADIFARTRLCGWRARAQGSGTITFTRVVLNYLLVVYFKNRSFQQKRQQLEV